MNAQNLPRAPAITLVPSSDIDLNDPFFDELKIDYPEFIDWWNAKVVPNRRKCWVSRFSNGRLSSLLMYKIELGETIADMPGSPIKNRLKINTLNVTDQGYRMGELLIGQAIKVGWEENLDEIYLTHFSKVEDYLSPLLLGFGFHTVGKNQRGEDVYVKPFAISRAEWSGQSSFEIARLYAPQFDDASQISKFVVPVRSDFHGRLFPDLVRNTRLDEFDSPHLSEGNAIKKAYICRAQARTIRIGDILLFYQSRKLQGIQPIGIVESIDHNLLNSQEVFSLIRKRTVYTMKEIEEMVQKGPVTVLLFRYQTHFPSRINLVTLEKTGILNGPPQSITKLDENAYQKLKEVGNLDRRLTLN